ncbi:MAG: bacteriohemerythrin [Burkholderiaceae bacterium]|nr:bacteriohemerythrin [Burkholderiaceae bacterium]MDP1968065.1 bacteriohemerythrin [Burkholderiaceae bacterium]
MQNLTVEDLLAAADRFVPPRMLVLIGAETVADVTSGQHVERMVNVLFTDIEGYTAMVEAQPPAATFQFINDYLSVMEPVVESHGGVIDKFIGDAIMALFPDDADSAVECALELSAALAGFNEGRVAAGQAPIRVGIGINTGMVSVGAIGTGRRLEITVLGDTVNLAARLESATRAYGVQMLVSEGLMYALARPQAQATRFVDRIRVKGKLRPVSVYEVFGQEAAAQRELKLIQRSDFELGVVYYHSRHCEEALEIFERLFLDNPHDGPIQVYLRRCKEFLAGGEFHGTDELAGPIEWQHGYEIGFDEIDDQHREWCKRLNDLIGHLRTGRQQGLLELFQYLRSYIEWHFTKEEALMDRYDYPFARQHKQEHARYAQELEQFNASLLQGDHAPLLLTFRANLFLVDWFINHTTGTDRHLGHFLAAQDAGRDAASHGPSPGAVAAG